MENNNYIFSFLSNIFYTQKNDNKILIPIIKCESEINNIIAFFEKKENDIKIKYNILMEFYSLFKSNNALIPFFMKQFNKNNINFLYKIIFDIYLTEKIEKNKLTNLENMILLLTYNYSLQKSVPEYIYQILSKFLDTNNNKLQLTNSFFMRCLNLLSICLCDNINNNLVEKEKIKNYFYFSGNNSYMNLMVNKNYIYGIGDNPNLENGLSFVFWINLDKNILNNYFEYNLVINIITIKISDNAIKLNLIKGKYFILEINNEESEPIDITKNFTFGKWVNVSFIINKKTLMNQKRFKLFIDGNEVFIDISLPKNFPWKNKIENITLFNNLIGKVSSVIFFSFVISQKLINYLSKEIKGGFYKNKILTKFLIQNDINYLKNSINYKYYQKYKNETKEKLINILLKEKNMKNIISIFSPFAFNKRENTIDDIFGNYIAVLSKNDGVNNYINHFKNIEVVGGLNNLLPISELILLYKNIISEEILIKYFSIIKNFITSHNYNLLEANKNFFFTNLSLFLEKIPSELFTKNILDILIEIGKYIFQNNGIKYNQDDNYMNNILLNEKIFGKFNSENQIKLWEEIYKFFTSDYLKMKEYLNIFKINNILRFYDKNKYHEFCCKKHCDLVMINSKKVKKVMEPEMNIKIEQLFQIIQLFIKKFGDQKEIIILYRLLILDLSPCLQNKIIQVYINYFDDKSISEKTKLLTLDNLLKSNFISISEYLLTISLLDVHYKLIKLFQTLFHHFPSKIYSFFQNQISLFFDYIGKYLLLNEHFIEINTTKKKSEDDSILEINNDKLIQEIFRRCNSLEIKNKIKKNEKYFIGDNINNIINKKEKIPLMKVINKEIFNKDKDLLWNLLLSWLFASHDNDTKKKYANKITNYLINLCIEFISEKEIINIEYFLITLDTLFQEKEGIKFSEIHLNKNLFLWVLKIIFFFNNKENTKNFEKNNNNEKCIENIKNKSFEILKIILQNNSEDKSLYEKSIQFIYEYSIYVKNVVDQEKIKEIEKKKKKNEIIRITCLILLKCCEAISNNHNNFNITSKICFNYLLNFKNSNFIFTIKNTNIKNEAKTFKKNEFTLLSSDLITDFNTNKKEKYNNNNFNKNKDTIIPKYILEDINYTSFFKEEFNSLIDNNNSNKNYLLKEIWRDFHLYDYIIDYYYSNLWGLENLCKIIKIEYDNNINILMKKLFKEYSNKKNKNILINNIKDLLGFAIKKEQNNNNNQNSNNNINNNINNIFNNNKVRNSLSLYNNINILTINIILLSIANEIINDKVQKEYLENQYQQFIIFCIILSINIKSKEKKYDLIQNELYNIIGYGCIFLKAKKEIKYQQIINNLIIPILKASNPNYQIDNNSKYKGIKKVLALTKKNIYKNTAIFKLFRKNNKLNQKNINSNLNIFDDQYENINRCNSVGNLMRKLNLEDDLNEWDNENEDENTRDNTGNTLLNEFEEINIKNHEITADIHVNKNRVIEAIFGKISKKYKNINKKIRESIKNFFVIEKVKIKNNEIILNNKKKIFNEVKKLIPDFIQNLNVYKNNSFIEEKTKRNRYKKIKIKLFSWNGAWSDKYLFYLHPELLKYKTKNHFTKEMIKPLLIPVYDINYYLPKFKSFDKNNLFNKNNNYNYTINLDIDKILKSNDNNNIILNENNSSGNNYLESIYKLNDRDIWKLYYKNNINNNLKDNNITLDSSNIYFPCCLVKVMNHIKGNIFIKNDYIKFIYNNAENKNIENDISYDKELGCCYGSIFKEHISDKEKINLIIKYKDIKFIFYRNYYYRETALEFFLEQNKSYFFNFKTNEDLIKFLSYIIKTEDDKGNNNMNNIKFRKIVTNITIDKDKKKLLGYEKISNNIKIKTYNISSKVEEWQNYNISTLEFLMWLNIYSGRSFHDLNQYPVFPWLISNYKNEKLNQEEDLRNLNLPIGMLELNQQGVKRKNNFIQYYENLKNEFEDNYPEFDYQNYLAKGSEYIITYKKKLKKIDTKEISYTEYPYNFGTHYSNSTYVSHFLSRIFPFSFISIEIQGNKFDDPERMFYSLEKTFSSVSSLKDDVRELIPEFYFFPEIFKNINNINLSQDKYDTNGNIILINDVEMPLWSDESAINFVLKKRKILEKNNLNINNWIDLIFGSKQRGENAEKANNIYMFYTYEKMINIFEIQNKGQKCALLRLFEMGATPKLLFKNDLKPKLDKNNLFNKGANSSLKSLDESKSLEKNKIKIKKFSKIKINNNIQITEIKKIKNEKGKIMVYINTMQYFKIKTKPDKNKKEKKEKENKDNMENKENKENIFKIKEKNDIKNIENISLLYSSNYQMNLLKELPIIIYHDNKIIIKGGFWDGRLELNSLLSDNKDKIKSLVLYPGNIYQPIICMKMSLDEKILICGCLDGTLIIIDVNEDSLSVNKYINHHSEEITSIEIDDNLNMFATSSLDGYIMLYILPSCQLVRSININISFKLNINAEKISDNIFYEFNNNLEIISADNIFLSSSPLPSIIIFISSKKMFVSYTINGGFINNIKDTKNTEKITCYKKFKSINFEEFLIYGTNDGFVKIRAFPKMYLINYINIYDNYPVKVMELSEDKKCCYVWGRGDEIVIVVDNIISDFQKIDFFK